MNVWKGAGFVSRKRNIIRYRLALDLGSTSLGWAILRLNAENEPTAIIRAGVRIFSDGRNPKDGSSLAVTRRTARAMNTKISLFSFGNR